MAKQTEDAKKMQDRADALADALIDAFGYTDGQLVATLTIAAIGQRIIKDKLDGKYEPPTDDEAP